MAASFLPYCAHCDKQIVIPNSGILYCSESCRKKDKSQGPVPITGSAPQSSSSNGSATPPLSPSQSFAELPPAPTFIPPSSPTSARSIPFAHTQGHISNSEPIAISASENCLRRSLTYDSAPSSPTNSHNLYHPPRRPAQFSRASTTSSYMGSTNSGASTPYYPMQGQYFHYNHSRPLPPSHHPYSYSSSPRSVDLVTPLSSVSSCSSSHQLHHSQGPDRAEAHNDESGLYEKKWALPLAGGGPGSLKKLFNFDGMRASATPGLRSPALSRASSPVPMSRSGSSTSISSAHAAVDKNHAPLPLEVKGDWSDIY